MWLLFNKTPPVNISVPQIVERQLRAIKRQVSRACRVVVALMSLLIRAAAVLR